MKFGVIVFPGSNCDHDAFYAASENLGQPTEYICGVDPEERAPDVPLTELTRGPGLASAGATASYQAGILLLPAVIGYCG